jgi:hypothetical protein
MINLIGKIIVFMVMVALNVGYLSNKHKADRLTGLYGAEPPADFSILSVFAVGASFLILVSL